MKREENLNVPWKRYTYAVSETLLTFTLASFCLGVYLSNGGLQPVVMTVSLVLVYLFVAGVSIYRMFREFSIAATMLMIPIAPLVILIIVVALIHLLQFFS